MALGKHDGVIRAVSGAVVVVLALSMYSPAQTFSFEAQREPWTLAALTPTPSPTPRPTDTPRPQPTATPGEATDVAWSEAEATWCVEREDFDCAVRVYAAAYERHPSSSRLRDDLYYALLLQGMGHEENQNLDAAIESYERAFALDPAKSEASAAIDNLRPFEAILYGDGLRSSENEGVETGRYAFGDTFYEDRALHLTAKDGQGIVFPFSQTRAYARSSIQIRSQWIDGLEGYISLSYVDKDNTDDRYELHVNPNDGRWQFMSYHQADGTWVDLIPWTYVNAESRDWWTLELRLVDGVFYIFINRELVGSASGSFTTGHAGFGVGTYSGSQSVTFTAAFNDLRIFAVS